MDPLTPGLATLRINKGNNESRDLKAGPIYEVPTWQKLPETLAHYKRMRSVHPSSLDEQPVFVDLGPISFTEGQSDVEVANLKEKAVRDALALGEEPDVWCQFLVFSGFSPHSDAVFSDPRQCA